MLYIKFAVVLICYLNKKLIQFRISIKVESLDSHFSDTWLFSPEYKNWIIKKTSTSKTLDVVDVGFIKVTTAEIK